MGEFRVLNFRTPPWYATMGRDSITLYIPSLVACLLVINYYNLFAFYARTNVLHKLNSVNMYSNMIVNMIVTFRIWPAAFSTFSTLFIIIYQLSSYIITSLSAFLGLQHVRMAEWSKALD